MFKVSEKEIDSVLTKIEPVKPVEKSQISKKPPNNKFEELFLKALDKLNIKKVPNP